MQPTKSKGTRYQPKGLYIAATVLLAIATFYSVGEQFAEDWFNQFNDGLSGKSLIQWRAHDSAVSESKRTKKPILYAFLTKHDTASLQMYGDGFHDGKIAALINSGFIPVRVDYNRREYNHPNPLTSKLHNQYGYTSTCELLVVPSHMIDMSINDIESTANLSEAGIENTAGLESGNRYQYNYNNRYRNAYGRTDGIGYNGYSAKFAGYTNKRELIDYLYGAQHWHQLPPTKGKVAWVPLSVGNTPLSVGNTPLSVASAPLSSKKLSAKPRLLVFVDNAGSNSDSMRLDTFWNSQDYSFINQNFEPVLLEFHHDDAAFNKPLEAMKEKYGITSLPALVIESKKLAAPLVQFGHNNSESTREFLKSGVKKSEIRR